MASVYVDVDLDDFSDQEIIDEYKHRELHLDEEEALSKVGGRYHEDAIAALRRGDLRECLHCLTYVLGREFDRLPDLVG